MGLFFAFITAERGHEPKAYHTCADAAMGITNTLDHLLPDTDTPINILVQDLRNGTYLVIDETIESNKRQFGLILDMEEMAKRTPH